ncbi:Retroviral aspartyl protease [Nesidiocoris tenuis]|uniref:Retroviral aspartyl protease n=1 Tax=Nesidiocoris tenuis TaxID=355587 RepID=A0ABN7AC59_9HEMI|nr:Retroviral aspartyl protease [Nesidiocoris tenuis]
MCKSKYVNEVHGSDTGNSSDEEYYVNAVQHGKEVSSWNVDIKVDSKPISFKIDTGAECSILKWEDFSKLPSARITNSDVTLFGPGKEPLDIAGKVRVLCEYNKKKYHWKILRSKPGERIRVAPRSPRNYSSSVDQLGTN